MIRDPESFDILLGTVSRFVRERLIPREQQVVDTDAIPADILQEMRGMGLFGLTIPEQYGGLGLTMEEEVRVSMELCRAAPAFRSIVGTNNGIGSQGIVIDGTEEQKRRYLPRLAAGELIGSFALTEPGAGSDAAALTTSAKRDGAHYVLNGAKRYITNAPQAGVFTVMARTDLKSRDAAGVSAFIVERDTPGLSVGKPDR
jgi:acyl-CoA dehydrogenase